MLTLGDQQWTDDERKKATKEARDASRSLTRLLLGGNAGGAAVALAMIHSLVGKKEVFPAALLLVLAVFVVGLACAWFVLARDLRLQQIAALIFDADKDTAPRMRADYERLEKQLVVARRVAGCTLVAGVIAGTAQLAFFARWPL